MIFQVFFLTSVSVTRHINRANVAANNKHTFACFRCQCRGRPQLQMATFTTTTIHYTHHIALDFISVLIKFESSSKSHSSDPMLRPRTSYS